IGAGGGTAGNSPMTSSGSSTSSSSSTSTSTSTSSSSTSSSSSSSGGAGGTISTGGAVSSGGAGGAISAGGAVSAGGGGGAGGVGGALVCGPLEHICNGLCTPNTPQTGCLNVSCTPCPVPANGMAVCTLDGHCDFSCFFGYEKSGSNCICAPANEC